MTKTWQRMKRIALALFRRRTGRRVERSVVINGEKVVSKEEA